MLIFGYIGPGAGFAFFSSAILIFISAFILLLAFAAVPFKWTRKLFRTIIPFENLRYAVYVLIGIGILWLGFTQVQGYLAGEQHPRFVVLGMDGLDPGIVRSMINRGELPNFARLKERGDLDELGVPNPPISPTSWASFITGTNPGRHGVLGFIGRKPKSYTPQLFTHLSTAESFLNLPANLDIPGQYQIPLSPPSYESERRGTAFWDRTANHGIRSTMIRVPVTFPPENLYGNGKMLSGLGTPDLRGTQGSYSYWYENPEQSHDGSSGEQQRVRFFNNQATSSIIGPSNSLLDRPRPTKASVTFDRTDTGARITIGETKQFFLPDQEWSDWKSIHFPLGMGMNVTGIARFHLNDTDPFELYMTPIQIDPKDPVMAISTPESYAPHLAKRIGRFYTMGMAQDDKALKEESISDTTFLQQTYQGLRERRRMLGLELRRERNGLIVGVFDSIDRIQHLFWRYRDPDHPLYQSNKAHKVAQAIPDVYRKMDEILGEVLDSTDKSTPILVVSDHGFKSFRRQFHLNDWLVENGYMSVKDNLIGDKGRFLRTDRNNFYVDWENTQAYQVGLTGLYINVEGREGRGSVPPEKKWDVARQIKQDLEQVVDPRTGDRVFKNVHLSKNIYEGLYWQGGPDLILGFNEGYRTSWNSGRGELYEEGVVSDNLNKWSGDHVIDASLVPGTVMSSVPLNTDDPHITDVAATVLNYYDLKRPRTMDGQPLFNIKPPGKQ